MSGSLSRQVTIMNRRGLHARASAQFVKCASRFQANVRVHKDGHAVDGTSIMGLMTLAAAPGSTIELEAEGPQAQEALDALSKLVEEGFGETD
jgi:phosphocarrier protein